MKTPVKKSPRNKNWVKRNRFLIIPKPLKDELLSSWLTRTAFAHQRTLPEFFSFYIKREGTQFSSDDLDFRYNRRFFKTIALKSTLNYQTIYKMSIRSEEGYLFHCNNCLYPPLHIRKLKDKRTHYGLLFCPHCLREDSIPYFRKFWRYTFYNACPKHKIFLADRCGVCYERVRLDKMKPSDKIVFCSKCGNDLRKTRTKKVPMDYQYGVDAIKWFLTNLNKGYFIINKEKVNSLWIFESYKKFYSLLNEQHTKLTFSNFPMLDDYIQLCQKLDHYHSSKAGAIYRNFFLTSMIYHLYQNYPLNLLSFSEQHHLTHRDFVHYFKDMPYWYKQQIDELIPQQNKIGREITKTEVLNTIRYLQSINANVTQESVANILGCHFTIHKGFVDIYKNICYSDLNNVT